MLHTHPSGSPFETVKTVDDAALWDPLCWVRALTPSISGALFCVNEALDVVWANEAGKKQIGLSPVPGSTAARLRAELESFVESYLKTAPGRMREGASGNAEVCIRLPNGGSFHGTVNILPSSWGSKPLWLIHVLESSAREAADPMHPKLTSPDGMATLANGVAHDFNNVLTAVVSHLDLALTSTELAPATTEDLKQARSAAMRGVELVRRLQSYSQSGSIRPVPTALEKLVQSLQPVLRHALPNSIRLEIVQELTADWLVLADANQLSQVLINLCLNARDAMLDGGLLQLRVDQCKFDASTVRATGREGEFARITVSDTGVGMSEPVLRRLFEPYFTTKAFGKGIGLGLMIAQNLVVEHHGWMEVESVLGSGSRFSVYLPRHKAFTSSTDPQQQQPTIEASSRHLEGTERILIVDDEEMIRLVMKSVLSYRGYTVKEAVDGEEALTLLRGSKDYADLILLDVHMPRLNGWRALQEILRLNPKARVIMLSGDSREFKTEAATQSGAMGFIEKPFEGVEFLNVIRRTLDDTSRHPMIEA